MEESTYNLEKMNPQTSETLIGTKKTRSISIYPLSVRDQMKMADTVVKAIATFIGDGKEDKTDAQLVVFVTDLIQQELPTLLKFVIDEEENAEDLLGELTNEQALEIGRIIYDTNFGSLAKKAKDLVGKVKGEFLSERSSVIQSEDSPNIDSKTSSDEASKKEG